MRSHQNEDPPTMISDATLQQLRRHPLRFVCGWTGKTYGYFPMHFHRTIEIVHHPRGSGLTEIKGGGRIDFVAGGTVIYPARMAHDQRMHRPGEDICLHFEIAANARDLSQLFSQPLSFSPSFDKREKAAVTAEFLHLVRINLTATRQVELDLRISALVAHLLQLNRATAQNSPKTPPEVHLEKACTYIKQHYATIRGVQEVANHVGVSEDYLRHIFLESGGTSLVRLINLSRLERAKELLIHSRMPIKEIASLVGYKTERYLSIRFKSYTGVAPGAFRRKVFDSYSDIAPQRLLSNNTCKTEET